MSSVAEIKWSAQNIRHSNASVRLRLVALGVSGGN